MYVLLLLKKLGYKTLVVDPEPGYHPKTTEKTDTERLQGLIKIYENMGLKSINCLFTTAGFNILNHPEWYTEDMTGTVHVPTEDDLIEMVRDISGKIDTTRDTIIMVGDIDEMANKIKFTEKYFSPFSKILHKVPYIDMKDMAITENFMNVPVKFVRCMTDLPDIISYDDMNDLMASKNPCDNYEKNKERYEKNKERYDRLKKMYD